MMLYRYAQHMGYDVSVGEDTNILSYADALTISENAYPAMRWACGEEIMNGDDAGNLNPQSTANRAEAAATLQRLSKIASRI
ncbi:MAG: S-layer homology domain-containing protein [Oscillospiraceae bacterium]|nr:S-layer homology domain-containing protein [Oscillospiraceae bacterium]